MKKIFLVLLSFSFLESLSADLTIVQKVQSSGMMGQPARNGTMTIYIKGAKAKIENMGPSVSEIVDIDSGKIFMINATQKTVMVMSAENMKQFAGLMGQSGAAANISAQKTGNSKTINGYSCEEYKITMSGMVSSETSAFISEEIDTQDMERFRKFSEDLSKQFGGLPANIKGFPVVSDTKLTIMGKVVSSHTELASISKDSIPDSMFVVPSDYKVTEMPKLH